MESQESQPRRRRRPARSCIECRRRKIRCDRNDPCTRCVSVHIRCTYKLYGDQTRSPPQSLEGTSRYSTQCAPQSSPSSHLQPIRESIPSRDHGQPLEPRTTATGTPTPARAPHHGSVFPGQIHNEQPRRVQNSESAITDLLQRVQSLEQSSAQTPLHDLSETGREIFGRPSQPEDIQWIFTKTRVMRWSLWMATAKEVRYALTYALNHPANYVTSLSLFWHFIPRLLERGKEKHSKALKPKPFLFRSVIYFGNANTQREASRLGGLADHYRIPSLTLSSRLARYQI